MGHALLPPSSADKWMVCHGWYAAVKDLPPLPSSEYAEEGTEAHKVLEVCLRYGFEPDEVTDDVEMAEAVAYVTDWVKQYLIQNPGAEFHPEQWLRWGEWFRLRKLGGTSDLVLTHPEELVVNDYKHGKGVIIDPATSKQLRLYLLGAIAKYGERDSYRLVISQPRARHDEGPIREHVIDTHEVRAFMNEVENAVRANLSGKGKRKAGEHCRHWCAAAATCRELANHNLSLAIEEFSDPIG